MSIYTYQDFIKWREKERINGARGEDYRIALYKQYTGKNPDDIVYNGFTVIFPNGALHYYTIHYRTDNARPYAIYCDGSQMPHKTYIKRFYLEKLLKQMAHDFKTFHPGCEIKPLCGIEIIT